MLLRAAVGEHPVHGPLGVPFQALCQGPVAGRLVVGVDRTGKSGVAPKAP